ncbi:MAG TPA: YeeE/YedE thiosulfate transporter family protein [Ferruginibacter sp.]|nr:YeeE/YedE thiosulfate transporter family protein [Ferruginibacter sp.]
MQLWAVFYSQSSSKKNLLNKNRHKKMLEFLQQPWPWYVAGPLIGLTVPVLLILGNKTFGISSSFRHICASCMPVKIPFFSYNWKKEIWNLIFVLGILLGGIIAMQFLANPHPIIINQKLAAELSGYGITNFNNLVPLEIMNWQSLFSVKGLVMLVAGGFLVGFGTRYAGGCTSGHAIMGISNLQLPSLIATVCFMVGGFIMANFILPFILLL